MEAQSEEKIAFDCPECGAHLKVPLNMGGVTGSCPGCQKTIIAPERSEVVSKAARPQEQARESGLPEQPGLSSLRSQKPPEPAGTDDAAPEIPKEAPPEIRPEPEAPEGPEHESQELEAAEPEPKTPSVLPSDASERSSGGGGIPGPEAVKMPGSRVYVPGKESVEAPVQAQPEDLPPSLEVSPAESASAVEPENRVAEPELAPGIPQGTPQEANPQTPTMEMPEYRYDHAASEPSHHPGANTLFPRNVRSPSAVKGEQDPVAGDGEKSAHQTEGLANGHGAPHLGSAGDPLVPVTLRPGGVQVRSQIAQRRSTSFARQAPQQTASPEKGGGGLPSSPVREKKRMPRPQPFKSTPGETVPPAPVDQLSLREQPEAQPGLGKSEAPQLDPRPQTPPPLSESQPQLPLFPPSPESPPQLVSRTPPDSRQAGPAAPQAFSPQGGLGRADEGLSGQEPARKEPVFPPPTEKPLIATPAPVVDESRSERPGPAPALPPSPAPQPSPVAEKTFPEPRPISSTAAQESSQALARPSAISEPDDSAGSSRVNLPQYEPSENPDQHHAEVQALSPTVKKPEDELALDAAFQKTQLGEGPLSEDATGGGAPDGQGFPGSLLHSPPPLEDESQGLASRKSLFSVPFESAPSGKGESSETFSDPKRPAGRSLSGIRPSQPSPPHRKTPPVHRNRDLSAAEALGLVSDVTRDNPATPMPSPVLPAPHPDPEIVEPVSKERKVPEKPKVSQEPEVFEESKASEKRVEAERPKEQPRRALTKLEPVSRRKPAVEERGPEPAFAPELRKTPHAEPLRMAKEGESQFLPDDVIAAEPEPRENVRRHSQFNFKKTAVLAVGILGVGAVAFGIGEIAGAWNLVGSGGNTPEGKSAVIEKGASKGDDKGTPGSEGAGKTPGKEEISEGDPFASIPAPPPTPAAGTPQELQSPSGGQPAPAAPPKESEGEILLPPIDNLPMVGPPVEGMGASVAPPEGTADPGEGTISGAGSSVASPGAGSLESTGDLTKLGADLVQPGGSGYSYTAGMTEETSGFELPGETLPSESDDRPDLGGPSVPLESPPVPVAIKIPDPVVIPGTAVGKPSASGGTPSQPHKSLLAEPRKALDSFLAASTWKERMPFIYNAEKLRPNIEAYYRAYEDKPITSYLPEFDFMEDNPQQGRLPYYVYYLKISGQESDFPVMIMMTPEGPKVDWEAFVEFRDQHLATFVQKRELGPKNFRVLLTRESYWGSDRGTFTNLNDFLCYSVESPDNETEVNAFIHKNVPLAKELEQIASWGLPPLAATVELELKRFPHGADHLVINKVFTEGWDQKVAQ